MGTKGSFSVFYVTCKRSDPSFLQTQTEHPAEREQAWIGTGQQTRPQSDQGSCQEAQDCQDLNFCQP